MSIIDDINGLNKPEGLKDKKNNFTNRMNEICPKLVDHFAPSRIKERIENSRAYRKKTFIGNYPISQKIHNHLEHLGLLEKKPYRHTTMRCFVDGKYGENVGNNLYFYSKEHAIDFFKAAGYIDSDGNEVTT